VNETIHANQANQKQLPSATYSRLRQMAVLKPAKRILPRRAKRFLRRKVFARPATEVLEAAQFSPAAQAALAARLRPDALALLAHCGKPADFWDLG
jgi:hypothetical protein